MGGDLPVAVATVAAQLDDPLHRGQLGWSVSEASPHPANGSGDLSCKRPTWALFPTREMIRMIQVRISDGGEMVCCDADRWLTDPTTRSLHVCSGPDVVAEFADGRWLYVAFAAGQGTS